jgi:hypothetical protein
MEWPFKWDNVWNRRGSRFYVVDNFSVWIHLMLLGNKEDAKHLERYLDSLLQLDMKEAL